MGAIQQTWSPCTDAQLLLATAYDRLPKHSANKRRSIRFEVNQQSNYMHTQQLGVKSPVQPDLEMHRDRG